MSLHSNFKFAQRGVCSLARKAGEGTGMACFIVGEDGCHAR